MYRTLAGATDFLTKGDQAASGRLPLTVAKYRLSPEESDNIFISVRAA